jgi:hypothetical protein
MAIALDGWFATFSTIDHRVVIETQPRIGCRPLDMEIAERCSKRTVRKTSQARLIYEVNVRD